jgi:mono/diheme cytochrome c family protein
MRSVLPGSARRFALTAGTTLICSVLAQSYAAAAATEPVAPPEQPIEARIVAVGIEEPGAVAAVGFFHPGGPMHDDPELALLTRRGRVLDPSRVLVAAKAELLSIDPEGETISVPDRAVLLDPVSGGHGRVQLFPAAGTLDEHLALSIDNAFGGLSFSMAVRSGTAAESEVTLEPRVRGQPPGAFPWGARALALLGPSPERGLEAFAILTPDGTVARAVPGEGLRPLAPAGTVSPPPDRLFRTGLIFNWSGNRTLYAADPGRNAVLAFTLTQGDTALEPWGSRTLSPPGLAAPVDLAPANPESASKLYSSNTTLSAGSDIYVANRGNGTILRMSQEGAVLAVRRLMLPGGKPLGQGLLNGLAVSPDGRRLWVTVASISDQAGKPGALLEIPAFGPQPPFDASSGEGGPAAPVDTIDGERLFTTSFTPSEGLGLLFNGRSCAECHQTPKVGGMGLGGIALVRKIALHSSHEAASGAAVVHAHSIADLGLPCRQGPLRPLFAAATARRNTPPLFGVGLIETIPDDAIGDGGASASRRNRVRDAGGRERTGRFGWKASTATLEDFVTAAFRDELGMSDRASPLPLAEAQPDCAGVPAAAGKVDRATIRAVTAFVASLPPPIAATERADPIGRVLFTASGCAACHTPALRGRLGEVPLYSDLLLHDLGPALDDGIQEGQAQGSDWRTAPLWGLGSRLRFLHDGRALTVKDAILAHGGEGAEAASAFLQLTRPEQDALLTFLLGL